MFIDRSTRRGFAARLAALLPGLGFAGVVARTPASAGQGPGPVQKLDGDGKPAGKGFITPLIIHNGLIYIAGQGAHSRGNKIRCRHNSDDRNAHANGDGRRKGHS